MKRPCMFFELPKTSDQYQPSRAPVQAFRAPSLGSINTLHVFKHEPVSPGEFVRGRIVQGTTQRRSPSIPCQSDCENLRVAAEAIGEPVTRQPVTGHGERTPTGSVNMFFSYYPSV